MMDTPFTSIVERINHTLENVVAPEIESPIVRGQLFAVVEILNQIQGRFDYRHDFMIQDIQVGRQMLATLIEAFEKDGVETPEAISEVAEEGAPAGMSGEQLREARSRVEEAVSAALDLLDAHRSEIAQAEKVEKTVLAQLGQNILRDMMLFRPQRFDKISQRVQEE
jgi:hypothetical protein